MSELGERLIRLVREKAAEKPDFVYRQPPGTFECLYMHDDGNPGCILGHALCDAGLIDSSLYWEHVNQDTIGGLATLLELPLDRPELKWMREVQARQDEEEPWGRAVALADAKVPL